jgi:hypothetical protein
LSGIRLLPAVALVVLAVTGGQASRAASFNPDPVFPIGPISGTVSHQITTLDKVASTLAGRRVVVNCWSQRDWPRFQAWQGAHNEPNDDAGYTFFATHRIQLAPYVCQVLAQTLARSARQPLFDAFAITILAHESAHASGIRAEDRAECTAIRTEPRAARLLGISKPDANRFQHIYRGTIYPNDLPRYRSPACKAGLPGAVVPDTLGTTANLRPFKHGGTEVAHLLPGWANLGGSVGPLDPCAPLETRAWEVARFGEFFLGPNGASLDFGGSRLRTPNEFHTAVVRRQAEPRCDLGELRRDIRESHSTATISTGRIPATISRLSPTVHAYRQIWTFHGEKWDRDSISIFDRAKRTDGEIFLRVPVHDFRMSVELAATKALLHALASNS